MLHYSEEYRFLRVGRKVITGDVFLEGRTGKEEIKTIEGIEWLNERETYGMAFLDNGAENEFEDLIPLFTNEERLDMENRGEFQAGDFIPCDTHPEYFVMNIDSDL